MRACSYYVNVHIPDLFITKCTFFEKKEIHKVFHANNHKVISYIQRVTGRLLTSYLRQQNTADQTARVGCRTSTTTGKWLYWHDTRLCSLVSCVHWHRYDVTCCSLPSSMVPKFIFLLQLAQDFEQQVGTVHNEDMALMSVFAFTSQVPYILLIYKY